MSFLYPRTEFNNVIEPPLTQAVGYVVVVGIGLIIAFGITLTFK
jgi:hypothetical protein